MRTLLFVGRVHPVKAVDRLIEAFALVPEAVRSGWRLRIVGPDEVGWMEKLKSRAEHTEHVEFVGPKFGDELAKEYASCDCLALVSHTENFGATVVDAMAHGKVVITGSKTPWGEVVERKCGWWVDNDPADLSKAIAEMMMLSDDDRAAMGARGKALVEEKYTWSAVAKSMIEVYKGVLNEN